MTSQVKPCSPGLSVERSVMDVLVHLDEARRTCRQELSVLGPAVLSDDALKKRAKHFEACMSFLDYCGDYARDGLACIADEIDAECQVMREQSPPEPRTLTSADQADSEG